MTSTRNGAVRQKEKPMSRTANQVRSRQNEDREAMLAMPADAKEIGRDLIGYLRDYAREQPETAAMWCLGIGFVLGWKMKPW
jgi:hypothetical protein